MSNPISVVTLTKDRPQLLNSCLLSLKNQTVNIHELILIDNGKNQKTAEIAQYYKKDLPIKYLKTNEKGYPRLYNLGIHTASGKWILFLDDDCIASPNWHETLQKTTRQYPNAVIQGKTLSIPKDNIYAEIMQNHYQNWIASHCITKNTLKTFDNKNLCIPISIIRKQGLFDESLNAGSEDIELGLRYYRAGVHIFYEPRALAFHHERVTFSGFIQQHLRIAYSEKILDKKLNFFEDRTQLLPYRRIFRHIQSFIILETSFILKRRFFDVLWLPILYIILLCVRIYGYAIK